MQFKATPSRSLALASPLLLQNRFRRVGVDKFQGLDTAGHPRRSKRPTRCNACHAYGAGAAPPDASGQQNSASQPVTNIEAQSAEHVVQLNMYHYVTFAVIMAGGLLFLAVILYFTGDVKFQTAIQKVVKRLLKTTALKQLATILSAMAFVKYGLEPVIKSVRRTTKAQGPWEKSSEYYILREVYKPLEFLFLVAAVTTLAENFLPQVINIPKGLMNTVVRTTLSLTFVISAARVVFNIKSRIVRESSWQLELKGDLTRQRRVEALDKLMSLATIVVASVFGVKALGMDVNSVLAIGGVGGVAVGLAGREILENLFTGLIILSSNPFEVGEEVMFRPASGQVVEGIVVDVGWYRTTIRSFEREIFIIPNSVFSRNVVLNITRKNREWRFYEFLSLRLEDLPKVSAVVSDMRKILRQDNRIIQKLHRRVFLDKVTREDCSIYISFYVEATNRDAFMAVKQDLLLSFIDCVERNGAHLARNRLQLEMLPTVPIGPIEPYVDVPALPQPVDVNANANAAASPPPPSPPPPQTSSSPSSSLATGQECEPKASGNDGPDTASSNGNQSKSGKEAAAAGSVSNIVATPTAKGGKTPSGPNLSPSSIMAAIANAPAGVAKLTAAAAGTILPDAIVKGQQDGSVVQGSFDDQV